MKKICNAMPSHTCLWVVQLYGISQENKSFKKNWQLLYYQAKKKVLIWCHCFRCTLVTTTPSSWSFLEGTNLRNVSDPSSFFLSCRSHKVDSYLRDNQEKYWLFSAFFSSLFKINLTCWPVLTSSTKSLKSNAFCSLLMLLNSLNDSVLLDDERSPMEKWFMLQKIISNISNLTIVWKDGFIFFLTERLKKWPIKRFTCI